MIEPKSLLKNIIRIEDVAARIGKGMRLDRNERTTPLDTGIVKAVLNSLSSEEMVAYPELEPLYEKIARSTGLTRENILIFSGSDTGVKSLFEVYVEPGDEVVMLKPSYGMYFVYSDMFGAKKIAIEYDCDFRLPVQRVIDRINPKTKLVLLANPNHTGTVLQEEDICRIIEAAARHDALVLLDEAYHQFYPGTMVPYVNQFDNLIVLRTFSKAQGIAGLRIGYAVSQPGNIQNLHKVKLTHEITSVSARFAEYLLDHPEVAQGYVRDVEEGKAYIKEEMTALGLEMIPSVTNFVFIRLPEKVNGTDVVVRLAKKGISIKGPFKGVPLEGLIRITVGPKEQMKELMDVFRDVYDDVHSSIIRD
jgi:histidinol-phosphate aminotransferase